MSSTSLESIAKQVKASHSNAQNVASGGAKLPTASDVIPDTPVEEDNKDLSEFSLEEDEKIINTPDADEDEDDEAFLVGESNSDSELSEEDIMSGNSLSVDNFEITDDDIYKSMPDMPQEMVEPKIEAIRQDIMAYRRKLILQNGLTTDEATAAAMARLNKVGEEENIKYLKDNPNVLHVVVDKSNEDKLDFTDEEREKMVKAKVIKLEVVEKTELPEKKIRRVDKKRKLSMIQGLNLNLSNYSVPLPVMNDFVRFKGAQIIQLVNVVNYNDSSMSEILEKKADLVYNQLMGGSNLQKYDENGKLIMSFSDFMNKFLYHDLDMALYGILVASSMEEMETTIGCGGCNQEFITKFNLKKLLSMDGLSDVFKERFNDILKNKSNPDELKAMYEKNNMTTIVESPITHCRYHINYPTIARAVGIYRNIDPDNDRDIYLSALIMFMDQVHAYDKRQDDYIPIEEDEFVELITYFRELPQEELEILSKFIEPYAYNPKFIMHSRCEHCGLSMTNDLTIQDMVFLRAQGSSTEIQ